MARIYIHGLSISAFICSIGVIMMFVIGAIYHRSIILASRNDIIAVNATIVNCTRFEKSCTRTVCVYTKLLWWWDPKPGEPRPKICHEETYNCTIFEYILKVGDETMIPQSGQCTDNDTVAMYYSRDHFDGYKFAMEPIDPTIAIIVMSIIESVIGIMLFVAMSAMYCCICDRRSFKKILVPRSTVGPDEYTRFLCG